LPTTGLDPSPAEAAANERGRAFPSPFRATGGTRLSKVLWNSPLHPLSHLPKITPARPPRPQVARTVVYFRAAGRHLEMKTADRLPARFATAEGDRMWAC